MKRRSFPRLFLLLTLAMLLLLSRTQLVAHAWDALGHGWTTAAARLKITPRPAVTTAPAFFANCTIATQDFEATPATPTWSITAGSANISTATGSGDSPANQRIRGGSRSWQVNGATATLDLAAVNITGFTSVKATVRISSTSLVSGNGADLLDLVKVSVALNGGAFPTTPDITISGNSNARWSYNNTANDTTTAGTPISASGTAGTNAGTIHSTLVINIPDGNTSVALRLIANNNDVNEVWNVDDITLTGNDSASIDSQPTNQTVCVGGTANFSVSASGSTLSYQWRKGTTNLSNGGTISGATTATLTISGVTVSDAATDYNVVVSNACSSVTSNNASLTVNPLPTITLGTSPAVCQGTTGASLPYTATTGSPDQYSIDYNAAANTAGFVDVGNAALGSSPILLVVPAGVSPTTYNAMLTVRNSTTGCVSSSTSFTVTVNANPTITLGASPAVCQGVTSASLPFTATTGSPDQFSIDYDTVANAAGFADVSNAAFSTSPFSLVVPANATPATYNATLTVRNGTTGCVSSTSNFTVTVNTNPTITLGTSPTICQGVTTASLPYTATTGSPNQYSIVYDATALSAGFANVTNVALPTSPLSLTVPSAPAAGTYNGTLTVRNSSTACSSASATPFTVTITAPPTTATVGSAQAICAAGTTASLGGNTPGVGTGMWSIVSGGNGTFSDASSPTSTFTHTSGAGPILLRWTISNGVCTSSAADVTVTVNQPPTIANAGADQSLCNVTAATMAGNTPTIGTGAWSQVSGPNTATIAAPSSATTMMTGLIAGTYTFRWTISNAPCTASADDVPVTITPLPTTANAGATQNLCITSTATLAANSPSLGTGAWSVVAGPSLLTSQFSSTSANNAIFTPAGGAGSYTLRWTISNAPCAVSTSDVVVNFSAQPTTANAGADQLQLCGATPAALAANVPSVGSGAWSVVAGPSLLASQFSSASASNATFTPAGGAGTYTLRWTITNGACASADDVLLTYNTSPAVTTHPTNQNSAPGFAATFTAAASGTPAPTVQWQVSKDLGASFSNISGATSTTLSFTAAGADNGNKYRAVFTNLCGTVTTAAASLRTGDVPPLIVQAGGRPSSFAPGIYDPAICLDPGGMVGIEAGLTNPTNNVLPSSFTATLPAGLTAIAGACTALGGVGTCTVAANGGAVNWNGTLAGGETLRLIYRARIGANVGNGTQLCIDNTGAVNGVPAQLPYCFTVDCPLTNTRAADQKAGALLVFPYYTSAPGGTSDTRISITHSSDAATTAANQRFVHVFFIDGASCQQLDFFVCLTPNATFAFKASEYDPDNTGYIIAVAVDRQGRPAGSDANVLLGNAFVTTPQVADNYGAESFRANSEAVATVEGSTATLYFDQTGYDAVPKQFVAEVQSPVDASGQQIITAGLVGNLITGQVSGAAQVGIGLAFNEKEAFGSFSNWLLGNCQARGTISTTSPRVPNGFGNLIKSGQSGSLKFNVGGAVGLLLTPRAAKWKGIRALHQTQTTATTLTIPLFVPVC